MTSSASAQGFDRGDPSRPIPKVLVGQKALVTGANSGIGKATATALGQAGADVVVNYVSGEESADRVVHDVRRSGAKAYSHQADVSKEHEVEGTFRRMLAEFGTIDILVNNAGVQRDAAFHEMTIEQWSAVLAINRPANFSAPVRRCANSCAAESCHRSRLRLVRSSA